MNTMKTKKIITLREMSKKMTTKKTREMVTLYEISKKKDYKQVSKITRQGGSFIKTFRQNSEEIFITVCAALPWSEVVNNMETYGDFYKVVEHDFLKDIEEEMKELFAQEGMRVHVRVQSLNKLGLRIHGK